MPSLEEAHLAPVRTTAELLQLAQRLAVSVAAHRPDLLPAATRLVQQLQPCRHGPGFTSVLWHGRRYSFTPTQAAVVRQLWRAWRRGTPAVHQDVLLEAAGSETRQLSSLFHGHPAWGSLIVPSGKGVFRLS